MAEEENSQKPQNPASTAEDDGMDAVYDVSVEVVAVLGTAMMPVSQLLKLGRGAVVQLESRVDKPIVLSANRKAVAKGDVVVIDDKIGISLTEIIKANIG
jgi:flagellar motor switch protein FliN